MDHSSEYKKEDKIRTQKSRIVAINYRNRNKNTPEFKEKEKLKNKKYNEKIRTGAPIRNTVRRYDVPTVSSFPGYTPSISGIKYENRQKDRSLKGFIMRSKKRGNTILYVFAKNSYKIINEPKKFEDPKEDLLYIFHSIFSVFYKDLPFFLFTDFFQQMETYVNFICMALFIPFLNMDLDEKIYEMKCVISSL